MNRAAIVFLVLLRLAIGWHFFFEGVQKVESVRIGQTTTNRPFSSAGYFREATGPAGPWLRWAIGDLDAQALPRLTVQAETADTPESARPYQRVPEAIHRDWREYLARFSAHYKLDGSQRELAEKKLHQAEDKVVLWLTQRVPDEKTPEQARKYPSGEVKRKIPTAERIAEYRNKLAQIEQAAQKNYAFGRDVVKGDWRTLRTDAGTLRTGLMKDLEEQHYEEFRKDLDTILTAEQKEENAVPLSPQSETLAWIDWMTRCGLMVIGAGLLIGFLTRLNAWLAVGFLFTTYLAMPAFLWLPSIGPSEGNYLFVNKNLIEMLALCVIGTTATGRWFGIDTFIYWAWTGITGSPKSTNAGKGATSVP